MHRNAWSVGRPTTLSLYLQAASKIPEKPNRQSHPNQSPPITLKQYPFSLGLPGALHSSEAPFYSSFSKV